MKVFIQNQTGNKPRRWDKTGTVVECKDFDQYLDKVDGSGRVTLRNRKFLRQRPPIRKHEVKENTGIPRTSFPPVMPVLPPVMPDPVENLPASTNFSPGGSYQIPTENSHPTSVNSVPGVSYQVPSENDHPASTNPSPGGSYQIPTENDCPASTNSSPGCSYQNPTETSRPTSANSVPGVSYQGPSENDHPASTNSFPGGSYQTPPLTSYPTSTPARSECSNPDTVPPCSTTPPPTPVGQYYSVPQFTPARQMPPTRVSTPPAAPDAVPVTHTPESQRPRRVRVPNRLYNEADWELGAIEGQSSLLAMQFSDMLSFVAYKMGYVPRYQP